MLRARALEQALRMLIDAAVQTACKIAEDGDRRWHVVDLVCATNDAEKLLAVDPPPSGASPQAETDEDMGDGWYVTVGRWGESLVTIEQRCLSGKANLTDDDAALIRGAAKHLQSFIGQPAPVSPVEPTTCPKCRSNTRAYRLAVADVIDGRMAGMTSCRDEWHSRLPMVSPVEPEPPQVYHHYFAGATLTTCGVPIERGHVMPELNDVTCETCRQAWHERPVEPEPPTLRRLVADLQAHAREHNWQDCDEPLAALLGATVEPEPCVWRLGADLRYTSGCGRFDAIWADGPFCAHCGAPLKVER